MKVQYHTRDMNRGRKSGGSQPERVLISEEQTASTSTSSERAWMMLALILIGLTVGLYWFSEQHNDQPAWSYEVVVEDQAAEQSAGFVSSDQALIGSNPNERLVRRVYDEVINQHQLAVMDELFAEQVIYRRGETASTLSLAALKQAIRAESLNYAGLHYSIEKVIISGDWLNVEWLAQGTPLTLTEAFPEQIWSGFTAWHVTDGKIVGMWTYIDPVSQNDLTDDDQTCLPPQLQDSQDLAEYQFDLSSGYRLC